MTISVIIPTYNPQASVINQTLDGLKAQTLESSKWQLIIVDNNSTNRVLDELDIRWHPNAAIVKETKQGLTYSRLCGFRHAKSDIVIMVDDDNILAPDYLEQVIIIFKEHKQLGALGGRIDGKFDDFIPEDWTTQFWSMLAIRDFGDQPIMSETRLSNDYPDCSPVGAGMAVRRLLLNAYVYVVNNNKIQVVTDRTANSLSSGGDNEIVINVLKQGYAVGYFPELSLQHIIPQSRLTVKYLSRLNYDSSKSWVKLLLSYKLSSYKKIPVYTVGLRKLKSWFTARAYASQLNYIKWKGYCGMFDGLADSN
jgi:glycosyltransferase involved in cell wall biosynthesis